MKDQDNNKGIASVLDIDKNKNKKKIKIQKVELDLARVYRQYLESSTQERIEIICQLIDINQIDFIIYDLLSKKDDADFLITLSYKLSNVILEGIDNKMSKEKIKDYMTIKNLALGTVDEKKSLESKLGIIKKAIRRIKRLFGF
jgi:hypothetical protein